MSLTSDAIQKTLAYICFSLSLQLTDLLKKEIEQGKQVDAVFFPFGYYAQALMESWAWLSLAAGPWVVGLQKYH